MRTIRFSIALIATALLPAAASAQSSLHADDTYYACYVPKSGTVYRIKVVGAPAKCAQNHIEFHWSTGGAVGPQGEAGPQGQPGPQGPQGPAGSGIGTVTVRTGTKVIAPSDGPDGPFVMCEAGEVALAGGHGVTGGNFLLVRSAPAFDQTATFRGWHVQIRNLDESSHATVNVWAVCGQA